MRFDRRHTNMIKGIGALLLLHYHIFIGYSDINYDLAMLSHSCVWIFVFLSGFGLTLSLEKAKSAGKSVLSWTGKHIWNLQRFFWPHYVIALFILYLFLGRTLLMQYGNYWRVALDVFCVSDILGQTHILGVWWYMGLALVIVAATPLIMKLTERLGYWMIPLSYIWIVLVPPLIENDVRIGPYQGYYPAMVIGVVFARRKVLDRYAAFTKRSSSSSLILLSAVYVLLILCLGMLLAFVRSPEFLFVPQMIKTCVTLLIVLLTVNISHIGLISRFLEFMGKLSDDLFLMHIPVKMLFTSLIYAVDIPAFIYLMLFILSVSFTFAFKKLKELVRYDKLTDALYRKLDIRIG